MRVSENFCSRADGSGAALGLWPEARVAFRRDCDGCYEDGSLLEGQRDFYSEKQSGCCEMLSAWS